MNTPRLDRVTKGAWSLLDLSLDLDYGFNDLVYQTYPWFTALDDDMVDIILCLTIEQDRFCTKLMDSFRK